MSEITKCWLQEAIAGIETIRDDMPFGLDEDEQKTLAALKMALAVLDAKPIAYMHHSGQVVTREECCDDKVFSICCKVETPLYTFPPAAILQDGLAAAVNRLLDSDGSRGTFSAIRRGDALAEVERLLAAAPAQGGEGG